MLATLRRGSWQRLLPGLLLALALASAATVAVADEVTCSGVMGAVTVDNLRVPQNATCTLNGTRVEGNIVINANATLIARNVRVDGNVQAENAARVDVLPGSVVGGSIQIVQSGSSTVDTVTIGGDLYWDDNDRYLAASANVIGGNLQAFQNTGGLSIVNNTIDGNLQCKENVPPPRGRGNIVHGNSEDQCANLMPGEPTPDPPPGQPPLEPPNLPHRLHLPVMTRG